MSRHSDVELRLEVLDHAGPTKWRWRLTDAGTFLGDHVVDLRGQEWQYTAFHDLHGYLRHNAAPDRRLRHEAELVDQLGEWITERVFGGLAAVLARHRRPVRIEVPAEAGVLACLPWELARVDGRTLAGHRVGFIIDQQPHRPLAKSDVGERLRMLAVFSLPEDAGALNLRKERFALARLVHEIAAVNNKPIELRVLQYGATRERLREALLEDAGWDVVHLSGHGLPAGLVLEDDTGRLDLISSTDLVDLLDLAADQIKLVTLSACESAAVAAGEQLHLLGLAPAVRDVDTDADSGALPAIATEVAGTLDCAVLAMRYPVVDDFAIALAESFYGLVLGKGQSVARALALSLPQAAVQPPTAAAPAMSVATPTLFGPRAGDLKLVPPPGAPLVFDAERQKLADFPAQPERFVGRVEPMTRATTALAPHSGRSGILLHGMAGAGKTACALELAYTHQESFPAMAWHAAPPEGHDITTALSDFAFALERQLPGLKLAHLVGDIDAWRAWLPSFTEVLEQERVLVVLDNVESLLTDGGEWRDERWALLIDAMTAHHGLSRLVLTSRRRPVGLPDSVLVEPVHALSLREAVLLARELPHLRALIDSDPELARRTITVVQGHPKLIELADGHAADPERLATRLAEADETWQRGGTRLAPFLDGESEATDANYLAVLRTWTLATVAGLPSDAAVFFQFLCCLEESDRNARIAEGAWTAVWERLGRPGDPPDPAKSMPPLLDAALVAASTYRVHPGIAETVRDRARSEFANAVDTVLGDLWLAVLHAALQREQTDQLGPMILHSARSSAPYLFHQHRWLEFSVAADALVQYDASAITASALLPLLASAMDATISTEHALMAGRVHAQALAVLHPDHATTRFRELLDLAVAQGDFRAASIIAPSLINLLRRAGRLDEALQLADDKIEYSARAGLGPWTRIGDDAQRLQILWHQGRHQEVLDSVEQHRIAMATLLDIQGVDETGSAWISREPILNLGSISAGELGLWELALEINAEHNASQRARGASAVEQATTLFNDCEALCRLDRMDEAIELLRWCRSVFEQNNKIDLLSKTLSAQANIERTLSHQDRAFSWRQTRCGWRTWRSIRSR
ncbi:MAG TPA: CHAT domain-containing protein [Pseudonocardiaceae bacterium]|nr:CHAT domain-containing protein [Pseudonocardiaceae bacterium]